MTTVTEIALMLSAAIMGIAALWHFYWALGGSKGLIAAIPERPASSGGGAVFAPSRVATMLVASAIAAIAALYGSVACGFFKGSDYGHWAALSAGVVGLVFVVRAIGDFNYVGFFKRKTGSPFADADSRYYSPLCLFLGASGLLAAATRYL